MFSRTCEYGIKIMAYLWQRDYSVSPWAGVQEIADGIESPTSFTAKVLQQLTKQGLLNSVRGPKGGFARVNNKTITLADIVKAIDGEKIMTNCVLGFQECSSERPCPVHHKFVSIKDNLKNVLNTTEMEELTVLLKEGKVVLKQ